MTTSDSASRSYTGLPAISAMIDGVPVYDFGRTMVYGVSPDLTG
jgi:hypothetical protein